MHGSGQDQVNSHSAISKPGKRTDEPEPAMAATCTPTEEKSAEDETMIQTLFDGLSQAVWATDATGAVVADSPSWRTYTGQTPDEWFDNGWLGAVHPDELDNAARLWQESLATGRKLTLEVRLRGSRGAWRWSSIYASPLRNVDGAIRKWVGMNIDITQHKSIEIALKVSEERYRTIVNTAHEGIAIINPDGRIIFVNKILAGYLGYTIEDMLGSALSDYIADDEIHRDAKHFQIRNTATSEKYDLKVKKSDGSLRWMLVNDAPIYDKEGDHIGGLAMFMDITDRKKAELESVDREKESAAYTDELEQADIYKNQFLSTLSHELRNPLATIVMGLSMLDQAPPGSETAARAKAMLARQTRQLSRLVDDLLDITRINADKIMLKKEPVDLVTLVEHVMTDQLPAFQKQDITLTADLTDEPLLVDADPVRLTQVIGNLLHNALKFTENGGTARISLTRDDRYNEAMIRIADTGIGIAPDRLPALFMAFSQADPALSLSKGGLGLGLFLAKNLVELHDGFIEATSEGLGHGSQFTVHLPLTDIKAPPAQDTEEAPND